MIRRFTADNFKSIKHLDLPMRSFSVLVGPNGAGKTNIVNALELTCARAFARPSTCSAA